METNIIIFGLVGIIGLIIIILGFKFSNKTRKVIETTGAIIFHVGVFGILYYKVSLNLFISLVTLVISLFILIDPLKISLHLNSKLYRLFGYLTLFVAVAFSLDYFSGFPVWLWGIPLIIYLAPYLISPLKKWIKIVMLLAWLVVIFYVGLIGYVIYSKYNPSADITFVKKILPQIRVPTPKEDVITEDDLAYHPTPKDEITTQTQPTEKEETFKDKLEELAKKSQTQQEKAEHPIMPKPEPTHVTGPYLNSLHEADKKYIKLQNELNDLKTKYQQLLKDNQSLRNELNELKANQKPKTETL